MIEIDPAELEKLDPVTATIATWTNPGPNVDEAWHQVCKMEVATLMPLLAQSLDRLVGLMDTFDQMREDALFADDQNATAFLDDSVLAGLPRDVPENGPLLNDGAMEVHVVTFDEECADAAAGADNDPEPDYATATVEEMGARGLRVTMRLKLWGKQAKYRGHIVRETRIREAIIVHLNNRVDTTQREIGELMGLSAGRVATLVGRYYDRLNREEGQGKK